MTLSLLPAITSELKLDRSHGIMCALMQMMTDYMKLHILLAMFESKTTLAFHLFAYQVPTPRPNRAQPRVIPTAPLDPFLIVT